MLTVRFPDGTTVQYNEAFVCVYEERVMQLYKDREKKVWIASVPYTCIVEYVRPCSVTNLIKDPRSMTQQVIDRLRELPASQLVTLKRELEMFDARKRLWK
jgi:hypothetical protein